VKPCLKKKNMMIVEMRKTALDVVCLLLFFFAKSYKCINAVLFFALDLYLIFFVPFISLVALFLFSC
jgi:hypothetical protein